MQKPATSRSLQQNYLMILYTYNKMHRVKYFGLLKTSPTFFIFPLSKKHGVLEVGNIIVVYITLLGNFSFEIATNMYIVQ